MRVYIVYNDMRLWTQGERLEGVDPPKLIQGEKYLNNPSHAQHHTYGAKAIILSQDFDIKQNHESGKQFSNILWSHPLQHFSAML